MDAHNRTACAGGIWTRLFGDEITQAGLPAVLGLGAQGATVQGGAERTDRWLGGRDVETRRKPEELTEQERQRLHQAHQRLRNASNALEALTVVKPVRGRWVAKPAPLDALQAAQDDLYDAGQELWRTQYELLSLQPSSVADAGNQ